MTRRLQENRRTLAIKMREFGDRLLTPNQSRKTEMVLLLIRLNSPRPAVKNWVFRIRLGRSHSRLSGWLCLVFEGHHRWLDLRLRIGTCCVVCVRVWVAIVGRVVGVLFGGNRGLGFRILFVQRRGFLTAVAARRSEEHTSELLSLAYLVCRLLLEKKKKKNITLFSFKKKKQKKKLHIQNKK